MPGAVAVPKARQTQMNTRIDSGLKEAGDAVLARLGYTPSAAIRGFWQYAVDHQDDAASIRSIVDPDAASTISEEAARKLSATAELRSLYARTAEVLGIADTPTEEFSSWDELRDAWYDERLDRVG